MTVTTDGRRPGGKGRRTGELRAQRKLDPNATRLEAAVGGKRLSVLRDPLWEIQPGETSKAYNAFRAYRDLGSSRTQERAAQMLSLKNPQNPMYLADLSSRFRWVERCRAWDAYIDTKLLGEQEQSSRLAGRSWLARQDKIREMEYELSMGMAQKIREMLKYPVHQVHTRIRHMSGGVLKAYTEITIEPARWDWKAIGDMLKNAGFAARLSAEMVTDGARAPQQDGTDRGVSDIDAWLSDIGVAADRVEATSDDA